MAITKVSRNLLSTGIDDQSNATAITIDSSENVGIGVSPSYKLHLRGSQNSDVLYIDDGSQDGHRQLEFSSSSNGQIWTVNSQGDSGGVLGVLAFATKGTERMRINSAGALVLQEGNQIYTDTLRNDSHDVGTSDTTILDFSTAGAVGAAKGFYLVTVVRSGSSVGTHGVYLVGLSTSNAVILYETLRAGSGVVASTSGANFQIRKSGTTVPMYATAVPIGIIGN
jgi:hypothetical protein